MSGARAALLTVRDLGAEDLAAWAALERDAVEANPFHGPALAVPAAAHLPAGHEDRLLVVRDGDRWDLALVVRGRRTHRRVPVPTFRAWGHDHAYLDTPLLRDGDPERSWHLALDLLRERRAGWLSLERLAGDGTVRDALGAATRARGTGAQVLLRRDRPVVRRRAEPTYLEGRLSSSRRRKLARLRRRLEGALGGPIGLVDHAVDDLDGAVTRFLALESAGWKGRAASALASTAEGEAYFRAAMGEAGRAGRAQVWELGAPGTPVASLCVVLGGRGAFHLKTAYDERYADTSPGLQLEVAAVEAFHQDPAADWIDSCVTDPGDSPSSMLYPDSRPVESVLVPLRAGARPPAAALRVALARREARRRLTEETEPGAGDG